MTDKSKMASFKDLEAWKEGHGLVLSIYAVTGTFPKQEDYGLTSQMRRAAVSVTSNIAEGFGRRTQPDKARFYSMARGSATELNNHLIIAKDLQYLDDAGFCLLELKVIKVLKIVTGLLRKTLQNKK